MTQPVSINDLVTGLLDRNYERAVRGVLRAIAAGINSGVVERRLVQLDEEAQRLADAGERLMPDNAVLRALVVDLEPVLWRGAREVAGAAGDVQAQAVQIGNRLTRELTLAGVDGRILGEIGARWRVPDPEAINAIVDYVTRDAWADEVRKYVPRSLEVVRNQAIRGMVEGWNPLRVAREVRRVTEGVPVASANTTMRTLYIQSYRRAGQVYQNANADILGGQVRVASLDGRVCLACVALHGEQLPVGAVVQDHHNGRCVGVPWIRGAQRTVRRGPDWFNGLTEAQQLQIAGPGALELIKSGRATLRDFVGTYEDPVYGEMVRELSLARVMQSDVR